MPVVYGVGVGSPGNIATGLIAAQPAAGTAGRFYFATDVGPAPGTLYEDDGTAWTAIGGNAEYGYAEIATAFTHTGDTTVTDVTGLALAAVTVGDRPIYVEAKAIASIDTVGVAVTMSLWESVNGGAYAEIEFGAALAATAQNVIGGIPPIIMRCRRSVARGTTVAYKVRAKTNNAAATLTVYGAAGVGVSSLSVLQA